MAKGTTICQSTFPRQGRWKNVPCRAKKIAVQFTDKEFAEINELASHHSISFAAAVRYMIWGKKE